MRMSALAVIGEGLIEVTLRADGSQMDVAPGGDAGNIAVMAAELGQYVRLGGRVGTDPLGKLLVEFWRDAGVDVSAVRSDGDAATGLYLNTIAPDGGHEFVYWRSGSAGSRLRVDDLAPEFFADVSVLVVSGITLAVSETSAKAATHAVARARAHGARIAVVLNHRPRLGGDLRALAAVACDADVVIGSTEDTASLFGYSDPVALAAGPFASAELVLTDGGNAVVGIAEDGMIRQPVPAVPIVNTAGAGDALAGAYLARRLGGHARSDALAWGVAASALSVTRRGCARSYPTSNETADLAVRLLCAAS